MPAKSSSFLFPSISILCNVCLSLSRLIDIPYKYSIEVTTMPTMVSGDVYAVDRRHHGIVIQYDDIEAWKGDRRMRMSLI